MPGVSAKIVDLDTGEDWASISRACCWSQGPNVMKGYLDAPE